MSRHHSTRLRVQELERRDAPATLVGLNKITYQDADGDNVTVTLSKPVLTAANVATLFTFNNPFATAGAQQFQSIDLTSLGAAAAGTAITLTAVRSPVNGGDGLAALGQINASGIDLGRVSIDGDLGRLVAGDATTTASGLKGLMVQSLGRFSTTTGASDLRSAIQGKVDFLKVKTDVQDAFVYVQGGADGKVGSVFVGGSVIGGAISADGKVGPVFVGGSVSGGGITSARDMGPVTIRGNLSGGGGDWSGLLAAGKLVGATIGGSVNGAAGAGSGYIWSYANMGPVIIRGNLTGGEGRPSGAVYAQGNLAGVTIGGDVVGGSATGAASLTESGFIHGRRIGRLTVGGSLIAGADNTSGFFRNNGAVRVEDDLGTVLIKGSIIGNATYPAIISARGRAIPTATRDVAIGSLRVLGRVEYAQILAGFDVNGTAVNADAQIGAVTVGGDWVASSIAAGAVPGVFGYGAGDIKMSGPSVKNDLGISSKITSLTFGGQALGTVGGAFDFYGIVAESVSTVKIGGTAIPLNVGISNDDFAIGITGDFKVHEV